MGRDNEESKRGISRRELLRAAGGGLAASSVAGPAAWGQAPAPLRWGIVGTGTIANSMASVINSVPSAQLVAVSSRRMSSANDFADRHGAGKRFDSWAELTSSDGIDAVYVATPTGVREEISVAAARGGKHVLAEKPFASTPSLRRIVAACRENSVSFMDGTHFGHHPRTAAIRREMPEMIGQPWSIASVFQFSLPDRGNIRYNRDLEPMGAIGDVGWYSMRAIAEYLPQDPAVESCSSVLRRDPETGAAVAGGGVLRFAGGAISTWTCGYDSGAVVTSLRLTGARGVITMDDFPGNNPDGSADYLLHRGGWENGEIETVHTPSPYTSRQLMFEAFAALGNDAGMRARSVQVSMRTQALLDLAWQSALDSESP